MTDRSDCKDELVKLAGRLAALPTFKMETVVTVPGVACNERERDLIVTALRRLASSENAVKVRELEWSPHPAGGEQALAAGLGLYRVHRDGSNWYLVPDHMGEGGKAAAQADYEARIRSALVEVQAVKGEPEPVAWRWQQPGWNEHWIYNPEPGWLAEQRNIVKQPLYTAPPADAGMREVLREAYTAGALAVHNEWLAATERGEGPPRGEPDFSEAASDYAALTAPGATTKSDGDDRTAPGQGSLIKRWKSWKHI